ncbi:HARBI1 [Mytilus edulis]|uniref:Putative nuclease HARBI1 n=1 Tax=Mytilus edulis TaxID=6550 RepID=A0A8S3RBI8_MYTED|nr:HARBI1 [Mytilus edulis]
MEDMLLFGNLAGNIRPPLAPKKYRERLLILNDLTDKQLRSRYRFGRQSIQRITDIVRDDITHPIQRSHALSAKMQVLNVDLKILVNMVLKNKHILQCKFTNIVARWPGSVHDSHIMRCSQISEHLEQAHKCVEDGLILGDSGYACRSFLMTPYIRPTEPYRERFHTAHTRTRCCIERTFGWWTNRFYCLHAELRLQPEKVCTLIMACAVLHNLAIEMREPMEDPDDEVQMFWNINIDFRGPDEGRVVTDHIARTFFA